MITRRRSKDFGWISHCIEEDRPILDATQPYAARGEIRKEEKHFNVVCIVHHLTICM